MGLCQPKLTIDPVNTRCHHKRGVMVLESPDHHIIYVYGIKKLRTTSVTFTFPDGTENVIFVDPNPKEKRLQGAVPQPPFFNKPELQAHVTIKNSNTKYEYTYVYVRTDCTDI